MYRQTTLGRIPTHPRDLRFRCIADQRGRNWAAIIFYAFPRRALPGLAHEMTYRELQQQLSTVRITNSRVNPVNGARLGPSGKPKPGFRVKTKSPPFWLLRALGKKNALSVNTPN